jgi:hypothetical protein
MKNYISIILFLIGFGNSIGQTFSNSTISTANSWNATLIKTITVSGLPSSLNTGTTMLNQVNLHLGRQADGTYNYSRYTVTLTSPTGTIITIVSGNPNPISFPNASYKEINTKFRDNSNLRTPAASGGSFGEPWHIGYYRVLTANSFSNFNGENPNGDWTLTITENSTSSGARFNNVDLVFGSVILINDQTSSTTYDDCNTPLCIESRNVTIASNNGFTAQATDMWDGNTSGCPFNGAQNNSAWFSFIAGQTNVKLTISGVTNSIQILGIDPGPDDNPCTSLDNYVLTGGCPIGLPNDTYLSPRYTNGSSYNNQLNMSGLVIGRKYYFFVDGTGGLISPLYIEIENTIDCCSPNLPNTNPADTQTNVGFGTQSTIATGFPTSIPSGFIAFDTKTKGLVIPRMTTAQRPIGAAGMVIYNTDLNCIQFHNGTTWKCIEPECTSY